MSNKHNLDPYRCRCGKSFATAKALKAHKRAKRFCRAPYGKQATAERKMQGYHQDKVRTDTSWPENPPGTADPNDPNRPTVQP